MVKCGFVPLTSRLQQEEQRLSSSEVHLNGNLQEAKKRSPDHVDIHGERNEQITVLRSLPGVTQRLEIALKLRKDINKFLSKVNEDEQPFSKVHQLSRQTNQESHDATFLFDSSVLQTRHRLLTESLLIRADFPILSDFLKIVQASGHRRFAFP